MVALAIKRRADGTWQPLGDMESEDIPTYDSAFRQNGTSMIGMVADSGKTCPQLAIKTLRDDHA